MQTTLELDDDVLEIATRVAGERGTSLDSLISSIVRESLAGEEVPTIDGVPIFRAMPGAPITGADIERALNDEDADCLAGCKSTGGAPVSRPPV